MSKLKKEINKENQNVNSKNNETLETDSNKLKKITKKIQKQEKKDVVEVIQQERNLPVYNAEDLKFDYLDIEDSSDSAKKSSKRSKKNYAELDEELLISDESAAYVQVVKEKHGEKRIVRYDTDIEKGLSQQIVDHRIKQKLTNDKPTGSSKTIPSIIFGNLFTFFNVLIALVATWQFVTFGISGYKYCFFVVIVAANIIISTFQEIRSKIIIDKLSLISAPTATVLRESDIFDIPVNNLVLDDIIVLSAGKQICSDAILVEGSVEVNESLLTGESDAISKVKGDILYSGSFVVSGSCKARVDRVGKDNYIEKLSGQAKKYRKPKSDLMKTLNVLIKTLAVIIVPLGIAVFFSQFNWDFDIFRKLIESPVDEALFERYLDVVKSTSGAIIGMIPSGLFLCTSIALAVGVIRLAQNKTLVQELYCIEMLARVDVLCLDKTGTITDGSMSVRNIIEFPNDTGVTVKNAISAMQNALNESNVTSQALEEKFGRVKRIKHTNTIPFSSVRKFSAVEFERYGTFILGAPEFILTTKYNLVASDVAKAANEGYRVLLLAHSNDSIDGDKVKGEIFPIALILIEDTIRPDAAETIEYFKQSGVEVKVISGDNPLTVSRISERAGIKNADQYISLEGLTDKEVIRAADKYTVFGRVTPNQKKILILTLKELGKTVAMTGDGVNDILALREADCSIALASGSEAARNASHLVLLDSNFSSMPKVVAEGRRVINNVQKVASLFLTKTIFSFLLAIYCCFFGEYPISTNQLFVIEMFVIGIPSFVLALEPNNNKFHGKFFKNVIKNALPGAIVITVTTIVVFALSSVLGLKPKEVTTVIVVNATFACFMVFFKVSKPFNVIRRILFGLMAACACLVILALPDFLDICRFIPIPRLGENYQTMGASGTLLTLCLIQATYPLIKIVENFKSWSLFGIKYLLSLVNKIPNNEGKR